MPGGPQRTFRPVETGDLKAISRVHHRACLIAYRFIKTCARNPGVQAGEG
jgi:hypothetical protein